MDALALVPDESHGDWNYEAGPLDGVGNSITGTFLSKALRHRVVIEWSVAVAPRR